MYAQFLKLTVICNGCFWLTMGFRYLKAARNLNAEVLNTIIVLGLVAALLNIMAMAWAWKQKPVRRLKITPYFVFNTFSFFVQVVSLILYFL